MSWWPPPGWELATGDRAAEEIAIEAGFRLVGRGPGDQVYRDACWPGEDPKLVLQYEKKHSACALLAACYMRCIGVVDPPDCDKRFRLAPPYVSEMAVSRLVYQATKHNAHKQQDMMAVRGELLIIGEDSDKATGYRNWGGPGHALLLVNVDGSTWESIDGGRGKVAHVTRHLLKIGGHLWLKDRYYTRRIQHRIRLRDMLLCNPFVLPPLRQQ